MPKKDVVTSKPTKTHYIGEDVGFKRMLRAVWYSLVPRPLTQESLRVHLKEFEWSEAEYEAIFREIFFSQPQSQTVDGNQELRVGTWNIQLGYRYRDVLKVLQTDLSDLDMIALQEVSRWHKASGKEDLVKIIDGETDFNCAYATSFVYPEGKNGKNPEFGVMILSRHIISDPRVVRLSPEHDWYYDKPHPRLGERVALNTIVTRDGKEVVFYSTHLELRCRPAGRVVQLEQIFEDYDQNHRDKPALIAADTNAYAFFGRDPFNGRAQMRGFQDPVGNDRKPTLNHPLVGLKLRVTLTLANDRILSRGLELSGHSVLYEIDCTDHFPVIAVYRL